MRIITLLLTLPLLSSASIIYSNQNGAFTDPESWSESANFSTDTFHIQSEHSIQLSNNIAIQCIIIDGQFTIETNSTLALDIHAIKVNKTGSFDNNSSQKLKTSFLENNGTLKMNEAILVCYNCSLHGQIKIDRLRQQGNLFIAGRLEIEGEIESEGDTLQLKNYAKITLSGTQSETEQAIINCMSNENFICFNRNSFQYIPLVLNSNRTQLILQNEGKIYSEDSYNYRCIRVGKKSQLQQAELYVLDSLIVKGGFEFSVSDSLQWRSFTEQTYVDFDSLSEANFLVNRNFLLPPSTIFGKLKLIAQSEQNIHLETGSYFLKNGINVDSKILFHANQAELNIFNTINGPINCLDSTLVLNLHNMNLQSFDISPLKILSLINSKQLSAHTSILSDTILIQNSSVQLASFRSHFLDIKRHTDTLISNGSQISIMNFKNNGFCSLLGLNAEVNVGNLTNFGNIHNSTANWTIQEVIENDGTIWGAINKNTTWHFLSDSALLQGSGKLSVGRLVLNGELRNHSKLTANNALLGAGTLINFGTFISRATENQTQINIHNRTGSEVIFTRNGRQVIPVSRMQEFHNLTIAGQDVQLQSNINIANNLNLNDSTKLDINASMITANDSTGFRMGKGSLLVVGKNENNQEQFPIKIANRHIILEGSSSILWKSKGNKTLPNWEFKNLILDDGNVDASLISFEQDTLMVKGFLDIEESSSTLILNNQSLCLKGNIKGAGNCSFNNSIWLMYGSNKNNGNFTCNQCTYSLLGDKIQSTKNGNWHFVNIQKDANKVITSAHDGIFQAKKIHVKNGELALGSESLIVQDSLIIEGKVSIHSARQSKQINHLLVQENGILTSDRKETLKITGNIISKGEIHFSKGIFHLKKENGFLKNNGLTPIYIDELILDSSTNISGDLSINSKLIMTDSVHLYQSNIKCGEASFINLKKLSGDVYSSIKTQFAHSQEKTIHPFGLPFDLQSSQTYNPIKLHIDFIPSNNIQNETSWGIQLEYPEPITSNYLIHSYTADSLNTYITSGNLNEYMKVNTSFSTSAQKVKFKFGSNSIDPLSVQTLGLFFENGRLHFSNYGPALESHYLLSFPELDTLKSFGTIPKYIDFNSSNIEGCFMIGIDQFGNQFKSNRIDFDLNTKRREWTEIQNQIASEVWVYNIEGKLISHAKHKSPSNTIFGKGIFLVKIILGGQLYHFKVKMI